MPVFCGGFAILNSMEENSLIVNKDFQGVNMIDSFFNEMLKRKHLLSNNKPERYCPSKKNTSTGFICVDVFENQNIIGKEHVSQISLYIHMGKLVLHSLDQNAFVYWNEKLFVNAYFITHLFAYCEHSAEMILEKNKPKSRGKQKTYLMNDSNTGYTKIGKSLNPSLREKTLQSEKPTITLFATLNENIESHLHEKYERFRVRGEWFNLSREDINSIISNYNFKMKN
jgi:hypothetical protein